MLDRNTRHERTKKKAKTTRDRSGMQSSNRSLPLVFREREIPKENMSLRSLWNPTGKPSGHETGGGRVVHFLLNQEKGIAVHFFGGVFENVNRVAEFSNGGKDIDRHAFRAGSRLLQIQTFLSRPWAGFTEVA